MEDPIIASGFRFGYHPDNVYIQCNRKRMYSLLKKAYKQNDTVLEFIEKIIKKFGNMWIISMKAVMEADTDQSRTLIYDLEKQTFFAPVFKEFILNGKITTDTFLGCGMQDIIDPLTNGIRVTFEKIHKDNSIGSKTYIKTLTGKTLRCSYEASMTISNLKAEIEMMEGVPVDQQRLIYDGKQLEDYRTMMDYGICRNKELLMVLRLRGGMHHISSGRIDYCSTIVS
ncbi:MAG: ubiquitin-like protein [Melioribacteraceae bacterium]|nr:ubiquitin-like protein [Melioribacteraceae bacterium]